MHLAIINIETNVVENIAVPPQGSQAWFVPEGYTAILSDEGRIGQLYIDGQFVNPPPQE